MLTDNELALLNLRGFIPGPSESEEDFLARVDYCLNLKRDFEKQMEGLPLKAIDMPTEISKEVDAETNRLFGITLNWVPIVFNNYKMAFWHGGCAWLFQMSPEAPMGAFFQLRSAFKKSSTFLGIYEREEVVAHESAHIGRMKFEEPKFEEIFAYRTAKTAFRRYFGPIIQSQWESLLFFAVFCLCLAGELYTVLADRPDPGWMLLLSGIKVIAILMIALGVLRVVWRQRQLTKCLSKLSAFLKDEVKANSVAYRLTDHEIIAFGNMPPEEIDQSMQQQKDHSLRLRAIISLFEKKF